MTRLLFCASFVIAAVLTQAENASAQPAQNAPTTMTYHCSANSDEECKYFLYRSDCKEAPARNGHPSLVYTHTVISQFSLKVGESKTFQDLPPNTAICSPLGGRLVFRDCIR